MSDPERGVAVELADLRGCMSTGFARLEERLAAYQRDLTDVITDVGELDRRVRGLEDRRWPVAQVGALSGVISTVVAVGALVAFK